MLYQVTYDTKRYRCTVLVLNATSEPEAIAKAKASDNDWVRLVCLVRAEGDVWSLVTTRLPAR